MSSLIDRRDFMKLMGAAMALAQGACTRAPKEQLVPYAHQPEGLVQGLPMFFATALTRAGYAHGVLVESQMGRPTKIEGNPHHPASLGSTGPIEQGRILELWDPERSRACLYRGQIVGWEHVLQELRARARTWDQTHGKGVRLLIPASGSPTLQRLLDALVQRFPEIRIHVHEPFGRDATYQATRTVFGRVLEPIYRFDRAKVIVSLDADFLGSMPGHVRYARDFAAGRRPDTGVMSRHYAAECSPTLTGVAADHALALRPSELHRTAAALWECVRTSRSPDSRWLQDVVQDLAESKGASVLLAGDAQPPPVHELAYALNDVLGNVGKTVEYIDPVCRPGPTAATLQDLVEDMRTGQVSTLFILGVNPAYSAPGSLEFASAAQGIAEIWQHGLYMDETAALSTWHVPAAHELESWGDARAFDGTASLQQPLIAPLYGGHSALEILGALLESPEPEAYSLVRETWQSKWHEDFERRWQEALHRGVIPDSASPPLPAGGKFESAAGIAAGLIASSSPGSPQPDSVDLLVRPDPHLWDGRFAPIAWLQELPRPFTQLTWGNAALMNPSLAARLGLTDGDRIELSAGRQKLVLPAFLLSRHAPGAITVHAGGGRQLAGPVGTGWGGNAAMIQTSSLLWNRATVTVRKVAGSEQLATVQHHHRMEGRDIIRVESLQQLAQHPASAQIDENVSLYPPMPPAEHAWAMAIDLTACIGCNACTIACQAENNIPTVGKDEVLRGREMHWIRIDQYEDQDALSMRTHFQPVPCMQCEHAPCELVCPVEASVHDPEGINVQVYNRCVGTRFCSNNCPYKVRRFNFFQYAKDDPALAGQRNPEVTVRMRGVMEKCNYCLQRVVRARIAADRDARHLADGDVVTACQAVCPTRAITFGDLHDQKSAVSIAKKSGRNYTLLADLNTRPRTSYLAKITNPRTETKGGS
jgi:molybdopterin-containing oxidoreductase family iron-sulfur binding subunit